MSFSIDDLAASLSTSHIGQEALDLAALQAQLAQSLFGQSIAQASNPQRVRSKTSFTQPCNTPTSSSFTSPFHDVRQGQASGSEPSWYFDRPSFDAADITMEEDERMVEALLIPCSTNPTSSLHILSKNATQHLSVRVQTSESSSSSFTSTDPFYVAQYQAQYHNPTPHSAFTQLGELPHQSPFSPAAIAQRRLEHPGTSTPAPPVPTSNSMDTHPFFPTSAAAFDFDH
ncbi:hypothetical protein DXG03_005311 [Asterophora parasitica]|uniref:Uncharacterized protein n=1 Tax=Asterophora parasitica TaxID=117018 RepID=A0A9P7G8C8_9AGAR|nr:hypothetical protein DXG03_005311 [Asterophora parasitica]